MCVFKPWFSSTPRTQVLILAALLLMAQTSTLQHTYEHDTDEHVHSASCDAFIAYADSPAAKSSLFIYALPVYGYCAPADTYRSAQLLTLRDFQFIRAPPV